MEGYSIYDELSYLLNRGSREHRLSSCTTVDETDANALLNYERARICRDVLDSGAEATSECCKSYRTDFAKVEAARIVRRRIVTASISSVSHRAMTT
jgi:hypothetical protein